MQNVSPKLPRKTDCFILLLRHNLLGKGSSEENLRLSNTNRIRHLLFKHQENWALKDTSKTVDISNDFFHDNFSVIIRGWWYVKPDSLRRLWPLIRAPAGGIKDYSNSIFTRVMSAKFSDVVSIPPQKEGLQRETDQYDLPKLKLMSLFILLPVFQYAWKSHSGYKIYQKLCNLQFTDEV